MLFNIANPGSFLDYDLCVSAMGYIVSHNASYGLPMLQTLYSFPITIYVAPVWLVVLVWLGTGILIG